MTSRSVTPVTSWANNPHHFQARVLNRMLCAPSGSALSQPQPLSLQKPLNCLFTSCAALIIWQTVCMLEYSTDRSDGGYHLGDFLCSSLSPSGTDFNQGFRVGIWSEQVENRMHPSCSTPGSVLVWVWFEFHTAVRAGTLAVICCTVVSLLQRCVSSQTLR